MAFGCVESHNDSIFGRNISVNVQCVTLQNSRIARSMTVSVRYLSNPSPVVASRACAVTKYDAEKFANDAYSLILKLNNAPAHQAAWYV